MDTTIEEEISVVVKGQDVTDGTISLNALSGNSAHETLTLHKRQLYKLDGKEGMEESINKDNEAEVIKGVAKTNEVFNVAISPSALLRRDSHQMLCLIGVMLSDSIILIDTSWCTHFYNVVDTLKHRRCPLLITSKLWGNVFDRGKVLNSVSCRKFEWMIQGLPFGSEVRVFIFYGCDLEFGVQWLKENILVTMDDNLAGMFFKVNYMTLLVQGIFDNVNLKFLEASTTHIFSETQPHEAQSQCNDISVVQAAWLQELIDSSDADTTVLTLIEELVIGAFVVGFAACMNVFLLSSKHILLNTTFVRICFGVHYYAVVASVFFAAVCCHLSTTNPMAARRDALQSTVIRLREGFRRQNSSSSSSEDAFALEVHRLTENRLVTMACSILQMLFMVNDRSLLQGIKEMGELQFPSASAAQKFPDKHLYGDGFKLINIRPYKTPMQADEFDIQRKTMLDSNLLNIEELLQLRSLFRMVCRTQFLAAWKGKNLPPCHTLYVVKPAWVHEPLSSYDNDQSIAGFIAQLLISNDCRDCTSNALTVVIVSATCGGITFSCAVQLVIVEYLLVGSVAGSGGLSFDSGSRCNSGGCWSCSLVKFELLHIILVERSRPLVTW